jgi:arylsulfatase A-like enzyme
MPSRTSLLTSRRPDTSKSWTIQNDQYWRKSGGNFTTLPQRFIQAGYIAVGMGKVFHEGAADRYQDYKLSWSPEAIFSHADGGEGPDGGIYDPPGHDKSLGGTGLVHRFNDTDEHLLMDGMITDHAINVIEGFGARRKNGTMDEPFFLAIGLHKPHVPWWGPARFWDLYPIENVSLPPNPTLPTGVPAGE